MKLNRNKLRLSILKELMNGNEIQANDYGITEQQFASLIKSMQLDNIISGVKIKTYINGSLNINFENIIVTLKGEEYMKQNSTLMKTYKGLKEVRDWLPF